jgi:hypothetical protein
MDPKLIDLASKGIWSTLCWCLLVIPAGAGADSMLVMLLGCICS